MTGETPQAETETTTAKKAPPKRTIFILSMPGGAMLGVIPSVLMARLEHLTKTPVIELFQVIDGVSTGAIPAAGLNVRDPANPAKSKLTARDMVDLYCTHGPTFFPEIPLRWHKMITSNLMHVVEDVLDPIRTDEKILKDLDKTFSELEAKAPESMKKTIGKLRKVCMARWITDSGKKKVIKLCDQLSKIDSSHEPLIRSISDMTFLRTSTGRLSAVFQETTLRGIKVVRKTWAHDYKFDPKVMENVYKSLYGDVRMSDAMRSTYISAYDVKNNRIWTFFARRKDFFDFSPNAAVTVSRENAKLWDAVMASTANPFAFPPHVAESGILFSDKAIVHTPLNCVLDVFRHKPDDAEVKLVTLGTGKYLSREKEGDLLRDEYERYGVAGNLMRGKETSEISGYAMSAARNILRAALGPQNIYEFSPRLVPHNDKEMNEMPSLNSLNASDENMRKILNRSFSYIEEEDAELRKLARMLVDNLLTIGQIDAARHAEIIKDLDNPDPADLKNFRSSFAAVEARFAHKPAPEQDNAPPPAKKRNNGPRPS